MSKNPKFSSAIYLKNIKEKIKNFDYFELRNSFLFYYILAFGALPLALFLHFPSKYVEYFLGQKFAIIDVRIFVYLFLGFLFFILGYRSNFLWNKFKFAGLKNIFGKKWEYKRTLVVFCSVFFLDLIVKGIRIFNNGYFHLQKSQSFVNSSFYSLIGLLDWLGPTALAIAFVYYFYLLKIGDFRYRIWRVIAWTVFAIEFIYGFLSLSRFSTIIPILIYLIIKHYAYNRSFKRVIIAGLLIFFVLMPVINFYKNSVSFFYNYATENKIELKGLQQFVIDSSIGRVNQSKNIFMVFEKTNKFLYGRTLLNFFVSLGPPRFIWKNKPIINANGNNFGRSYGILSSNDYQTSVGPTIVGDLYLNFGVWGIIFGMLFFGTLFRFIFDFLIGKSNFSLSGIVIYSIFWIQIIKGTEDWIAPVWAGLVKLFVILLIIHLFLAKDKSQNTT